jgi:hypothetical protein
MYIQGIEAGQAEVEQLGSLPRQHHVPRLQVAVDEARAVGLVEGIGDLDGVAKQLLGRQRPPLETLGQGLPLEVLHDQVVGPGLVADVVEGTDVGVGEGRDGPRLALEALAQLRALREVRGQDLEGHRALEAGVAGPVDLAHASGPEGADDLVWSKPGAGGE